MRKSPTPVAPTFCAACASAMLLMLARSSTCEPSALMRGLVAVQDEPVLEVEELALHLAVGGGRLAVGADEDDAVAAVDDHQVARADLVGDPDDPGDGRDAPAPRQDRGVAGPAAGLGDDAGDRQVAQAHRLARQDLVGHQDHRLVAQLGALAARAPSGVASGASRSARSRRGRRPSARGSSRARSGRRSPRSPEARSEAPRAPSDAGVSIRRVDLAEQGLVVDDLEVALEDVGLGAAELLLQP